MFSIEDLLYKMNNIYMSRQGVKRVGGETARGEMASYVLKTKITGTGE